MGLYNWSDIEVLQFFASFIRVSFLFLLVPIFGDVTIPVLVRLFLAFTINLVVYPIAAASGFGNMAEITQSDLGIVLLAIKEGFVGIVLGFISKLFFEGLNFAFGYMGMQMGFSMASMYDHHTETNTPIVSQVIMILATLLFLGLNGHHLFLKALVQSYQVIPVGAVVLKKALFSYILETGSMVFWLAVKLSAPMALVIFLVNCAFGIVAKAVPQINVLVVSFTVNILVGFLVITLTLPVFGTTMNEVFQLMIVRMTDVLKYLA